MAKVKKSVSRKKEKTAVLLITPETGRLPNKMGGLANNISGKSGGLGEVISALCGGLTERGVECHMTTLNLPRRFQRESRIDDEHWQRPGGNTGEAPAWPDGGRSQRPGAGDVSGAQFASGAKLRAGGQPLI